MGRGTQSAGISDQFAIVMGQRRGAKRSIDYSAREEKVEAMRQHGTLEQRAQVEAEEFLTHPTSTGLEVAISAWKRIVIDASPDEDEEQVSQGLVASRPLSAAISSIIAEEMERVYANLRQQAFEELIGHRSLPHPGALYPKLGDEIERALRSHLRAHRLGSSGDDGPFDIYLAQRVAARTYREILADELDKAVGSAPSAPAIARKVFSAHPERAQHERFIQELCAEPWCVDIAGWLEDGDLKLDALAKRLIESKPLRSQLSR